MTTLNPLFWEAIEYWQREPEELLEEATAIKRLLDERLAADGKLSFSDAQTKWNVTKVLEHAQS